MSKRKRAAQRAAQEPNSIQIIAGLIGVIALIAIIWFVWSAFTKTPEQAANDLTVPTLQEAPIDVQPLATEPPAIESPTLAYKQYASAPEMTIDTTKQYFAHVKMANGGEFTMQLFADKAPITVNSFVFLARDGFFNGVTFHRVLDGFMAQGGDPSGTGSGGPGYEFQNEVNDLQFDKPGVVAMANAGPNTNGSQFFIMFGPYGLSESDYTIFGQVTEGMAVVDAITKRDPNDNPSFPGDAMESVTIEEK